MPAYNAERYIHEAIQSILAQHIDDFEFIIVNDGSTDGTERIIESFKDSRIVYINNGANLGLSRSFNRGIEAARGEYIARMDADDISLPHRFERELHFLKAHPEIDMLGSAIIRISESGKRIGTSSKPSHHLGLKWQSLFSTPLFHPTVMAKARILKNHPFNESLHNSEDYELWSRLLFTTNAQFANLEEPLLEYRVFKKSFTRSLNQEKRGASAQNTIRNIRRYISLTDLEEKTIVRLQEGTAVGIFELFNIYRTYRRAAKSFKAKEVVDGRTRAAIQRSLSLYAWFLLKRALKQVL